tara:strand:- start:202 stop:1530 length:1329 start_codon:yes stop_codon:yes gene_type:complete
MADYYIPCPKEFTINAAYSYTNGTLKSVLSAIEYQRDLGPMLTLQGDINILEVSYTSDEYGRNSGLECSLIYSPKGTQKASVRALKKKNYLNSCPLKTASTKPLIYSRHSDTVGWLPVFWLEAYPLGDGCKEPSDEELINSFARLWSLADFSERSPLFSNEGKEQIRNAAKGSRGLARESIVDSLVKSWVTIINKDYHTLTAWRIAKPSSLRDIYRFTQKAYMLPFKLRSSEKTALEEVLRLYQKWPYDKCWRDMRNNLEVAADTRVNWDSRRKMDRENRKYIEKMRRLGLREYKKWFSPYISAKEVVLLGLLGQDIASPLKRMLTNFPLLDAFDPDGTPNVVFNESDHFDVNVAQKLAQFSTLGLGAKLAVHLKARKIQQIFQEFEAGNVTLQGLLDLRNMEDFLTEEQRTQLSKRILETREYAAATGDRELVREGLLATL